MEKYKSRMLLLGLVGILILGVNVVQAQSDPNTRDLILLTQWFEGEFDNDAQVWLENRYDWKGNPDEKHGRLHTIHRRIDFEELGEYVFYVEEYLDDDPAKVSRQRIVSFTSLAPETGINMAIYFLKEADLYVLAKASPQTFQDLNMVDLFGLDGCDVVFQRQGEQYHGSMGNKTCQFGEEELKRYSVHDMVISKQQYWRVDRSFLVKENRFHKGHPTEEPHKMRKTQMYTCHVSFHEKAYYIPSEKDKKYKDVQIHNQGGMHWFENPLDGKTYGVQLREKEYPFYKEGSDFFMLRFIEKGQRASTLIVTAAPHPPSISFQMGWVSAQCKLLDAQ